MKCYLGLRFWARKNVCSPLQSEVQIDPSLHYSWGCAVGIFQEPMKHKQFGKSPTVFLINRALHYQAWGDHQVGARSSTMDCKRKTPDQGFPGQSVHTEQGGWEDECTADVGRAELFFTSCFLQVHTLGQTSVCMYQTHALFSLQIWLSHVNLPLFVNCWIFS